MKTRKLSRAAVVAQALALLLPALPGCSKNHVDTGQVMPGRFVLAYGSCATRYKPQPVWGPILASRPDLFLFLGDTIYADTTDMEVKRNAYEELGNIPGFSELRKTVPVIALWDDHDYGYNDVGSEYPLKKESQELFLDFFNEPADSPRRRREGVYGCWYFGATPRRLQVILLDTRFFRDPLIRVQPPPPFHTAYIPTTDRSATILGKAQWKWLKRVLGQPADLRILATGIQLVAEGHRGEKWGNFPHEKRRLFDLVEKTGAEGLVVISGDRHYAEISVERDGVPYPVYDITSSALNTGWGPGSREPNRHRIGKAAPVANFGLIVVDWETRQVHAEIRGATGGLVMAHTIDMNELKIRR